MTQQRTPKGTPSGGQFSGGAHTESAVSLGTGTLDVPLMMSSVRRAGDDGPAGYRSAIGQWCDAIESANDAGVDVDSVVRDLVDVCNHTDGNPDETVSSAVARSVTGHLIKLRETRPDIWSYAA